MMIVLSGYMGSGKSVIGKELARKLNYSFVDLDEEIEKNQGMKIPEIFSSKGEIYFRKIEIEVLKSCLKLEENTILALGGGTPCYGHNLEMIKKNPDTTLIYLKVDLKTLTARLDRKSTRLNSSHVAISYAVFCLKKKINSKV